MPLLAYWTHDLSPFLWEFQAGVGIRYYGLAYVLAFVGAWWLMSRAYRAGRTPITPDQASDLMIAMVLGVMVGGRLGYFVFYSPQTFWQSPAELIRVWDGGMSSHGGMLGVGVATWWFARKHQVSFWYLGDLITSTVPLGLMLGRLANFINGELWGKIADVPWAVIFPEAGPEPRHPSQLYQAGLEGLLLLLWVQLRFWRSSVTKTHPGQLAGEFFTGYAIMRMLGELFRQPDAGVQLTLGLSRGSFLSVFVLLVGITLVAYARWGRPRLGNEP